MLKNSSARLHLPFHGVARELQVRRVDDHAPDEREQVAAQQRHDDDDARRARPQTLVDVAQLEAQQETADGGDHDDRGVALHLLVLGVVQQRAEILRQRIRQPAADVQRPEQRSAVFQQRIEAGHPAKVREPAVADKRPGARRARLVVISWRVTCRRRERDQGARLVEQESLRVVEAHGRQPVAHRGRVDALGDAGQAEHLAKPGRSPRPAPAARDPSWPPR